MSDAPLQIWADAIEAMIADGRLRHAGRVVVLASTASTQDAARQAMPRITRDPRADASPRQEMQRGGPGWVVLAGVQTSGRGRLGRAWHDRPGLGLAMTIALPLETLGPSVEPDARETLPLRVGLGACLACEKLLEAAGIATTLGLRWPNDIVERGASPTGSQAHTDRKVGGILIERDGAITLIGIGINVRQSVHELDDSLRGRAASLAMLGADTTRLDVACAVLQEVERALSISTAHLLGAWGQRDVLVGTRRTFLHDGERVSGVVTGVDPTSHIHVRADTGVVRVLPALTTSMVHDETRQPT